MPTIKLPNAAEDRCTDLLQVLNASAQSYCVAYGLDWTAACASNRGRKDKEPKKAYKMYRGLLEVLGQHNIALDKMITWETMRPLIEEAEELAAILGLEA